MSDPSVIRKLVRRAENAELPLPALEAVRELRSHLSEVERRALVAARARGANVEDIAEALGITRQAVYYKLNRLAGRDVPGIEGTGVSGNKGPRDRPAGPDRPRASEPDAEGRSA